jgi:hypothetical protein
MSWSAGCERPIADPDHDRQAGGERAWAIGPQAYALRRSLVICTGLIGRAVGAARVLGYGLTETR